jgi:hypothetical protein
MEVGYKGIKIIGKHENVVLGRSRSLVERRSTTKD